MLVAGALLAGACSSGSAEETGAPVTTSTAGESSTEAPSSTTATTEPPPPLSEGTVRIGDDVYELSFTCYAAGAGEVLAIGVGTKPDSGEQVEAYIQAFLGSPYVGLRIGSGEGSLIESAFDRPLDLYLQDDQIRGSAIRFVRGLDLDSGSGEQVGIGQIEISCLHYEEDLPS